MEKGTIEPYNRIYRNPNTNEIIISFGNIDK